MENLSLLELVRVSGTAEGPVRYALGGNAREVFGFYGPAEVIALTTVAAVVDQELKLFFGFDTLADGFHIQPVSY